MLHRPRASAAGTLGEEASLLLLPGAWSGGQGVPGCHAPAAAYAGLGCAGAAIAGAVFSPRRCLAFFAWLR